MNIANPLSLILKQAIQIVSDKEDTPWSDRLRLLADEIKTAEQAVRETSDGEGNEQTLKKEIKTLISENTSLEESLHLKTRELGDAKTRVKRETERHRELETRLEGLEERVLNALK